MEEQQNTTPDDAPTDSQSPWWCRHRKPSFPTPTGCRRVFIPIHGWLDADDDHRARVNRVFNVPMLVLAPAILDAIHDATGIWFDKLPVKAEDLLLALHARAEARV